MFTKQADKNRQPELQLGEFIRDLRQTNNLLRRLADKLHADLGITASLRAIMEYLALNGPATVPKIAEQRSVSRQAVQKLVDTLIDDDLLTRKSNPTHQKSDLIALTGRGKVLFRTISLREKRILSQMTETLPQNQFDAAHEFLGYLKTTLISIEPK